MEKNITRSTSKKYFKLKNVTLQAKLCQELAVCGFN